MKYAKHTLTAIFISFVVSSLSAQLVIEDFESYFDSGSLKADVFTFGSAAQAGKPSLAMGLGENYTNAACFNLTWETGNNANLCFINLSPNTKNLSGYAEITAHVFLEDYPTADGLGETSTATVMKLALEGIDGSIWQTRTVKAERLPVDSAYKARFRLSPADMERVEGTGSFQNTLSSVKNIRVRFENSRRSGFRQDAYIDSITAVRAQ